MIKTIAPIAYIKTDFPTKFGVPRQSGLSDNVSRVVFEKDYSFPEAVRGMENFSHIWLIWDFSENIEGKWSPTVRPPRLGGNKRVGVFATRSPFRPNGLGLSLVKLDGVSTQNGQVVLTVTGADLVDGTPIYDIKPYLTLTDCRPDAKSGFSDEVKDYKLEVVFPEELKKGLSAEEISVLTEILSQDPRPGYKAENKAFGFEFKDKEVKFTVNGNTLMVLGIENK